MTTEIRPEVPGRGAWSERGGLLRLKPGHTEKFGYYRLAIATEVMIGRAGAKDTCTYSERAVHLGVRAIQRALGIAADGLWGRQTDAAVRAYQQAARGAVGVVDGIAGPRTVQHLFTPLIRAVARSHSVPAEVLGGLSRLESSMDPGAVGPANGLDSGLCQINLGVTARDITMAQAFDPVFALNWSAEDLRRVYERWVGQTTVNPWTIAIANHNSPASAQTWARTGEAPFSQTREDRGFPQINEYVAEVRRNGEVFK